MDFVRYISLPLSVIQAYIFASETPSYTLAKFLVYKLYPITYNKFTVIYNEFNVKDSFVFTEEIVYQESKLCHGTFHVNSLLINIPVEETINICTNLLYNNVDVIESMNKT